MTEHKTENLKVPVTPTTKAALETVAKREDRSIAYIIRRAIERYLEQT